MKKIVKIIDHGDCFKIIYTVLFIFRFSKKYFKKDCAYSFAKLKNDWRLIYIIDKKRNVIKEFLIKKDLSINFRKFLEAKSVYLYLKYGQKTDFRKVLIYYDKSAAAKF